MLTDQTTGQSNSIFGPGPCFLKCLVWHKVFHFLDISYKNICDDRPEYMLEALLICESAYQKGVSVDFQNTSPHPK
jgi:hypothetical protein